jgi:hypothetical protein
VDGYFDILVDQLAAADAARTAQLRAENADLAEAFARYVHDQAREATRLGHHARMQQLLMAGGVLNAASHNELSDSLGSGVVDLIGRLVNLFLGGLDPAILRDALLAEPELLTGLGPALVEELITSEMRRATLERDVVGARQLWLSRSLLRRCTEVGVEGAFAQLERGALWPSPTERI